MSVSKVWSCDLEYAYIAQFLLRIEQLLVFFACGTLNLEANCFELFYSSPVVDSIILGQRQCISRFPVFACTYIYKYLPELSINQFDKPGLI